MKGCWKFSLAVKKKCIAPCGCHYILLCRKKIKLLLHSQVTTDGIKSTYKGALYISLCDISKYNFLSYMFTQSQKTVLRTDK